MKHIVHIDGSSRGNPGPAGAGVVIQTYHEGRLVTQKTISRCVGNTTNNVAEYRALLLALKLAKEKGYGFVEILSDSKLLVNQILGNWKIRDEHLAKLAKEASESGVIYSIAWIPRDKNDMADRLAQDASGQCRGDR